MKKLGFAVLLVFIISSAAFSQKCLGWSTGYFAQYDGGSYSAISFRSYTHLSHFALLPDPNNHTVSGISSSNAQNFVKACHNAGRKALICIGGAGTSPAFSACCTNANNQTTLVKSIINFMKTNGYDGVDMDWECGEEGDDAAMVAKFQGLHREIRDSLNTITPRPLFTAAVANWYPNSCASIKDYCDQMNGMSYYGLVNTMTGYFNTLTSRGVPKSKLGVGYGYDTDNEVDVNNPDDIGAKCEWAIANGYGGVMVWDIQRACLKCDDTTAHYVCTAPLYVRDNSGTQYPRQVPLYFETNGKTGVMKVFCTVPAEANGAMVDLGMYDVKGALVRILFHGTRTSGSFCIPMEKNRSGTYIFKLTTNSRIHTAMKSFVN